MTRLIEKHLERIHTAEKARVAAEKAAADALRHRNALIRQAFALGINRRLIAEAADTTRQGIYWINDTGSTP